MLTPRQRALYDFIRAFSERRGYAPSYDEMRRHLRVASLNAVAKLVAQLRRRGYLMKAPPNAKRWLATPNRDLERTTLPLLGIVAAGQPIEAIQTPEEIDVPAAFAGPGTRFALRVAGDSMIDEGIHDGDLVVVRGAPRAENGQTVVAVVDGQATLKRFHQSGRWIELRPANAAMKPIRVPAEQVQIRGVLIGLLRRYD